MKLVDYKSMAHGRQVTAIIRKQGQSSTFNVGTLYCRFNRTGYFIKFIIDLRFKLRFIAHGELSQNLFIFCPSSCPKGNSMRASCCLCSLMLIVSGCNKSSHLVGEIAHRMMLYATLPHFFPCQNSNSRRS